MCHSPTVNRYTPEGRAEIHRMLLKDAYIDVLLQLGRDNSTAESIEFCDNRLARFVAVKGKCEVSKQQLLFEDVVCHRFIPKEQGGTDEYKNLRIVHKDVAQLIYETDVNTIHRLIEKTGRSLHRHQAECRGSSPELYSNYNAGKQRVCGAFEAGEYRQLQDGRGYRSVGCTAPLRNQQSVRYGTSQVWKCGNSV